MHGSLILTDLNGKAVTVDAEDILSLTKSEHVFPNWPNAFQRADEKCAELSKRFNTYGGYGVFDNRILIVQTDRERRSLLGRLGLRGMRFRMKHYVPTVPVTVIGFNKAPVERDIMTPVPYWDGEMQRTMNVPGKKLFPVQTVVLQSAQAIEEAFKTGVRDLHGKGELYQQHREAFARKDDADWADFMRMASAHLSAKTSTPFKTLAA